LPGNGKREKKSPRTARKHKSYMGRRSKALAKEHKRGRYQGIGVGRPAERKSASFSSDGKIAQAQKGRTRDGKHLLTEDGGRLKPWKTGQIAAT